MPPERGRGSERAGFLAMTAPSRVLATTRVPRRRPAPGVTMTVSVLRKVGAMLSPLISR